MTGLPAVIIAAVLAVPGPHQAPPRDPGRPRPAAPAPAAAPDTSAAEADLTAKIAASPTTLALYYQLAGLQERRHAFKEAEATLLRAREVAPSDKDAAVALALYYSRNGAFEQTIAALETVAQLDATNPQAFLAIGTRYWDKVSSDKALPPSQQLNYIMEAVSAADRALALDADHIQALSFKSLLLKHRATLETDPAQIKQLVAEAVALRNRTLEINKAQGGRPMPNPSASRRTMGPAGVPGAPVRVGGNISVPAKVRDVKPIYPPEAQSAGIQGIVILETTVGADGRVSDAKVLRSIPLLDQAALDAVRQWEYTPTSLNGVAVPVIMTVTVNFSLP
jgi:TonB family protein